MLGSLIQTHLPRDPQKVVDCLQMPGDVMFVPHGWGHAVLNLKASAGFAVNIEDPFATF